ncbi:hypothetical protein [Streptomyces colonosanans]|uniref:Uncharacterized protein n=1 Tax=Streptomyces colonosanans TaxID=1428652 RepID=A0A1S2PHM8_9ACTN|nr:hypothetical protein [Streptomyces colonosanans]OIJ93281.1 hypothetical protein BIV24_12280 [Streptomyces colonosanans]
MNLPLGNCAIVHASGTACRIRTPPGPGKPSSSFCFVSRANPLDEPALFFAILLDLCAEAVGQGPGCVLLDVERVE